MIKKKPHANLDLFDVVMYSLNHIKVIFPIIQSN